MYTAREIRIRWTGMMGGVDYCNHHGVLDWTIGVPRLHSLAKSMTKLDHSTMSDVESVAELQKAMIMT